MTSPSFEKPSVVQSVTVLGSTGSIGINTLDVLARHSNKFSVFALTAYESDDLLLEQCQKFNPRYAVLVDVQRAEKLAIKLRALGSETEVLAGEQSLVEVAQHSLVDTVMAAIVGAAGLLPTLAAVRAGKKVLLANKEALVMAGKLFMDAVAESGSVLLPIDSEHNAIFQCLPQNKPASIGVELDAGNKQQIRKLLLTGSGGPFRTWSAEAMDAATVEQACKHPNWSMGQKISVDSATLMNKGLEFIEAKWLFDMAPSDIQVVIHPQSIVHSMVEYVDGSVLAQLGQPDMRTPIAHALAWPERIESGVDSLDWFTLSQLDFEAPDYERFPALSLCMAAASQGSSAPTVLNAANEVAVSAFLKKSIGFSHINHILDKVMLSFDFWEPSSISDVLQLDLQARESAKAIIARLN